MVPFPIFGGVDNAALIAWTTPPWTLPSNCCVNASLVYDKDAYCVARLRASQMEQYALLQKVVSGGCKLKPKLLEKGSSRLKRLGICCWNATRRSTGFQIMPSEWRACDNCGQGRSRSW